MDRNSDPSWVGGREIPENDYSPHAVEERPATLPDDAATPQSCPPAAVESDREIARRIEHGAAAVYAQAIIHAGVGAFGSVNAVAQYVSNISAKCTTGDPLEKMLFETIVNSYHRTASLHVASCEARTPEASIAYNSAAVKLSAEMRKSMECLRRLQTVPMEAGVYIQRIVRVERAAPEPDSQKQHTKLVSNGPPECARKDSHGGPNSNGVIGTQSTASPSRENQYTDACITDLRGPRKAAGRNTASSAVASRNGATVNRR